MEPTSSNEAWMRKAVMMSFLLLSLPLFSQTQTLSLRHGIYVQDQVGCKYPPFAAVLAWDGVGFAGAHSSRCTTRVVSSKGKRYDLSTICSAFGDGTPDDSGYVDHFILDRLSAISFTLLQGSQVETYRWCSSRM